MSHPPSFKFIQHKTISSDFHKVADTSTARVSSELEFHYWDNLVSALLSIQRTQCSSVGVSILPHPCDSYRSVTLWMYGQRPASLRIAAAQSYDLRRWVQVSDVPLGEVPVEMSPGKQFLQVTTRDLMDCMAFITSRLNTFLSSS